MADQSANKVVFELVTPARLMESGAADMVVVPGSEGDFGVLPGHTPFLTTLRPGVVDVHDDGAVTQRIFIAGGFAEANETRCTVLADEAVAVGDIDRADAEARIAAAREALSVAGESEKSAAEAELRTAEALLAATEGAPAH